MLGYVNATVFAISVPFKGATLFIISENLKILLRFVKAMLYQVCSCLVYSMKQIVKSR